MSFILKISHVKHSDVFYILFHTKREHLSSQKKLVQKLNVRYGGTTLQKKKEYNTSRQILTKHANSSKKENSTIQQCNKKVNYILSCEFSKHGHISFLRIDNSLLFRSNKGQFKKISNLWLLLTFKRICS